MKALTPVKKLHLRLPGSSGPQTWEIELAAEDPTPQPVADQGFQHDLILGDANQPDALFRLDLSELAETMEQWVRGKRASLKEFAVAAEPTATRDDPAAWRDGLRKKLLEREERLGVQAGPHDVVFPMVQRDEKGTSVVLRVVQNVAEFDDGNPQRPIASLTPVAVRTVEYAPTRAAMLTLFRAGTILSFLQQTSFPIGMTCYLVNILALAGIDPEHPDIP
jgi:hypothetical protein